MITDQNPLPDSNAPQTPEIEHHHRHTGRWVPGLILIVLGAVFLLNNLTGFEIQNWWALFFLLPAFGAFTRAWERYQQAGTVDRHVRQNLFGGLILTALAAVFLFNLNWVWFGPVLLILLGLTLLGNAFLP
jgi:putative Mn2+ efflux pump MntP